MAEMLDLFGEPVAEKPKQDLKAEIFGACLKWLCRESGRAERNLRPLLGSWVKEHGDEKVVAAFMEAQRKAPVDPISWMRRALRLERKVPMAQRAMKGWTDSEKQQQARTLKIASFHRLTPRQIRQLFDEGYIDLETAKRHLPVSYWPEEQDNIEGLV